MEAPVLILDTSSQASIPETEASMESNPICNSPTAVAYNSCSDSPIMDLPELQADMPTWLSIICFPIRKSLDLERQQAIWDFEALIHQWEAKETATKEIAKFVHSKKDLNARVKCAKAVMKAKYDYRVAIQEARAIRCSKLEESKAAYSEALSENVAMQSPFNAQHSAGNMQNTCTHWRDGV